MTLKQNLAQAAQAFERAGLDAPRLSAEVLLARLLGRERSYFYAHSEDELPPELKARWEQWVEQRAGGVPPQYLTGTQEFYGRDFHVSPTVLIPRPETELVVEAALELLPREAAARVADVGTGSGCIAVTLALERPRARVLATDASTAALEVARENAARLGAAVEFIACDLLDGVGAGVEFDLIVSNPPYLAAAEWPALQREVRDHEPVEALVAGPRGTEAYERLIPQAWAKLRAGGWLVLELGYASAAAVRALLRPGEWESIATRPDLQGWARVLAARKAVE